MEGKSLVFVARREGSCDDSHVTNEETLLVKVPEQMGELEF